MRLAGVDATAVTYNALIDACVSAGEPTEAMFALLSAMVDAGHRPDVVTYTTLLKHFGRDGDVVGVQVPLEPDHVLRKGRRVRLVLAPRAGPPAVVARELLVDAGFAE